MIKVKVLLPVERLGQMILFADPNQTFYQFMKPYFEEHNVDPTKYIIVDEFNKQFSMTKPMNQCGFYRGIAIEFKKPKDEKDLEEIDTTMISGDQVNITFTLAFNNNQKKTIRVYRYQSPQSVLLQHKIVKEIPDFLVCKFQGENYPIFFNFDDIGVFEDCEMEMVINEEVFKNQESQQIFTQSQDFVQQDSTKMTKQDYIRFKYEQKQWQEEMGKGKFRTDEDRQALKQARIQRKGIIMFKVLSTQLKKQQICVFQIDANGTLNDIYTNFDEVIKSRFNEEESAKIIGNYKFRQGRGGQYIEKMDFSAYDHFDGGNALLDIEVQEELKDIKW